MSDRGTHDAAQVDCGWLDLVTNSLPAIIWSTNSALDIVTCQGSELTRVGRSGEEFCGMNLAELCKSDGTDAVLLEAHRSALEGKRSFVNFVLAHVSFHGLVAPLLSDGKPIGCVTVALECPSFESRCTAIAQTTSDLILFLDPDGTIVDVNRTATGSPRERVIGRPIFEFTPRNIHDQLREAMDHVLRTGSTATLEVRFPRRFENPAWQTMRFGAVHTGGKVTGLVLLAIDITNQKNALAELEAEEALLQNLLELQDRERRLVAYEIHDGFIQDVVGARMILQGISQSLMQSDPDLHKRIESAVSLMARAIDEGRRLISELRPMIIDEMGIVDAIDYLISEEESQGDMELHFDHRMTNDRLPPLLQATVFRIIREAITNARRHGQANRVDIRLTQVGTQHLIIEVQDDGQGFDPAEVPKDRLGLSGIRERARLFGGGASIESSPETGTRITVKVAIGNPPDSADNSHSNWTWTV